MDSSPFSKLPAELRTHIFELALCHDHIVLRPFPSDRDVTSSPLPRRLYLSKEDHPRHGHPTALTQTCRQIHNETTRLFYSISTFQIKSYRHDYPTLIARFRHTIRPANSAALRRMILYQTLGSGLTATIPHDKEITDRSLSAGMHGDISGIEIHYDLGDGFRGALRSAEESVLVEVESLVQHCTELQRWGNQELARGRIGETECLKRFWWLHSKKQSLRLAGRVLSK